MIIVSNSNLPIVLHSFFEISSRDRSKFLDLELAKVLPRDVPDRAQMNKSRPFPWGQT
jgi:hypothetical protein